ncbi:MAG: LysM peptidoglycan-binding domain-containing protein [Chloroflexota bacterium]
MDCYACDREATQHCPRCGNLYCPRHGTNFCSACLDPLRSAPSRGVFRVALFGLFGGAVLALWLLVRPPSVPGEETVLNGPTTTPALTPAGAGNGATNTPAPSSSVATTPSGAPTDTPVPTATPVPTPSPTPEHTLYTVVDGDTWYGVAAKLGVDANQLAALNHLTLEDYLHPDQVLVVP